MWVVLIILSVVVTYHGVTTINESIVWAGILLAFAALAILVLTTINRKGD